MDENATPGPLVEGRDYTIDARGRWVFTADYLLRRGACCGSGCRNCPFEWRNVAEAKRRSLVATRGEASSESRDPR